MNDDEELRPVVDRLRGLYQAELRVAETSPHESGRTGVRSRAPVPLATIMVAAIALAGVVLLRDRLMIPATPGTGQPQPSAVANQPGSAGPTATPPAQPDPTPFGSFQADGPTATPGQGFPAQIDGQEVLVGSDVFERAASGTDETFLAAGWVMHMTVDCYEDCAGPAFVLRLSAPPRLSSGVVGLRLPEDPIDLHVGQAVVLSVHRDDASPDCAELESCAASVVVDDVVWIGAWLE